MVSKEGIISKMQIAGLDGRYISIVMDIPFQLYRSSYTIIDGKCLNFKWYLDQLRHYLKENITLIGKYENTVDEGYNELQAIRRSIITDALGKSMLDNKPVSGIVEDTIWNMLEYILLVYDNLYTDKDDNYWNSISAGEIIGFFIDNGKQPLIFKLEEAFYKLAEQIMSLVVISDNKIKPSDITFGRDLNIDKGCLMSYNRYDVKIGRFGILDIKKTRYKGVKSIYSISSIELDSTDKPGIIYGPCIVGYRKLNNMVLTLDEACSINDIIVVSSCDDLERLILVNSGNINILELDNILRSYLRRDTYTIAQMAR